MKAKKTQKQKQKLKVGEKTWYYNKRNFHVRISFMRNNKKRDL